jgi:anaerobic dimethyl sulfoxide reductase subunit C
MNFREWALPLYTILTQLAVGALSGLWVIRTLSMPKYGKGEVDRIIKIPVLIILITIVTAINGAHFHLSKPYLSFMAVSNLRTSWLSREIFSNMFFIFCVAGLCLLLWFRARHLKLITILGWVAIGFGLTTDYCMSRIYLLPAQPVWNSPLTPISFLMTMVLLGAVTIPVLMNMEFRFSKSRLKESDVTRQTIIPITVVWLAVIAVVTAVAIACLTYFQVKSFRGGNASSLAALDLLLGIYNPLFIIRFAMLFLGTGLLGVTAIRLHKKKKKLEEISDQIFIACLLVMIAEIFGRFLFFAIHVRLGI